MSTGMPADVKLPKYEDVKAHKGMAGWIPGIGRKIDRANDKIKDALGETSPKVDETNDNKDVQYQVADETEDQANEGTSQASTSNANGDNANTNAANATATAQVIVNSSDGVLGSAVVNSALLEEMNANCEPGKEEVMAQLTEKFDILNSAMVLLSANANEAAGLGAELEDLVAEQEAEAGGTVGGSFGSSISAGTYSLGTPGDNPNPPVGSKGKGGAITAGNNTNPIGSQGNPNGNAVGGSGSGNDRSAEIEAKYARFAELEAENSELANLIDLTSNEAVELQALYTSDMEAQQITAEESNETSENGVREANTFEQVCQKVVDVGDTVATVGGVMDATGTGLRIVGGGIKGAGNVMKGIGGMLSGISGVVGGLGMGLLGSVFTAVAGTALLGSSKATKGAAVAVKATGTGVFGTGVSIDQIGVGLKAAGNFTKGVGNGAKAVGTVGLTASYAVHGEWDRALTSGMQFIGSAISCLGDTAAFCDNMKAFGDQAKGIFKDIQDFAKNIDMKIGKALGGKPEMTQKVSGSTAIGDLKVENVADWSGVTITNQMDAVNQAGQVVNQTAQSYMDENKKGTQGTSDSGSGTGDSTVKLNSEQFKKATKLGLNNAEFKGMSSSQIDQYIAQKAKAAGIEL